MKFPAYGKSLWNRRLMGERIRVVALLVGDRWKVPKPWAVPADMPIIAVKTAPWHEPRTERFDWRLVAGCTVLAFDVRGPGERQDGPPDFHQGHWDSWLWLLADVQRFALDVLRITITEEFKDPKNGWAAERDLECFAWLSRIYRHHPLDPAQSAYEWPPWWPYGDAIHRRMHLLEAAA